MSHTPIRPCPICGVLREARAESICVDCRQTTGREQRRAAGYGPVPLDQYTLHEIRLALDELHRNYGHPMKDAA